MTSGWLNRQLSEIKADRYAKKFTANLLEDFLGIRAIDDKLPINETTKAALKKLIIKLQQQEMLKNSRGDAWERGTYE
jgi:hypothetical protein